MNHYYRPVKQDARYPTESPFSSPPVLDTRWLGGNRSPNDLMRPPIDFMVPPQVQQGRNTNSDFPPQVQQGRNTNSDFPPYFAPNPEHRQFPQFPYASDEKITFPSEENPNSVEHKYQPWPNHLPVPAINYKTTTKGSWKWVPDEDDDSLNSSLNIENDSKPTPYGLPYETPRPQTSHDRPYNFDPPNMNIFSHLFHGHNGHSQPSPAAFTDGTRQRVPTGPAAWPSSGSETLLSTEEYSNANHEDSNKNGNLDVKLVR